MHPFLLTFNPGLSDTNQYLLCLHHFKRQAQVNPCQVLEAGCSWLRAVHGMVGLGTQ